MARLFVSADIEGIVGVVTREQASPGAPEYASARIWMTDTVAAAAEAAFAAGIEEVVVADSHGPAQNLLIDRLPRRVQVVRGKPRPLGMVCGVEAGPYVGALFLGWHTGSTHASGILGHTMRGLVVREIRLNGRVVSEAGFYHPLIGEFGVPLIGISGDDQFVEETRGLVGDVEAAVVKWSYGHLAARTMVPADAHDAVAAMTRRALARIDSFRPCRLEGPVTLDLGFKHRPPAEVLSLLPGVERVDGYGIRTVVPDMRGASNFLSVALGYSATEQ
jgi:D-amino peptidase